MDLLELQIEKFISHLTEYEGLRGGVYTIGTSALGTFPMLLQINVLEIFQITSWGLSIIIGLLTIFGMVKKHIKEHHEYRSKNKKK